MMSDRLKILHCVAGNLYGGVEAMLRTLSECNEQGLTQEFAVNFEGRLARELRDAGATVHKLGAVRFSRPWTVWRARRRLRVVIKAKEIDVVVNHGCWPQTLCGREARRQGRAVVFWMHDMIRGDLVWTERGASRCIPDLALVNSLTTAETLPRLYKDVAWEILRYPVPGRDVDRLEAREAIRAETETPQGDVVIVIACRLEAWKGHALLLDALGRLRDKPGWTAWVVGGVQRPFEASYLDGLRTRARDLGIARRLRWLGQRDDVARVLAAADVHCQPNVGPEPFGIAFVEALYAGLPVVSTRMGGAAEIVNDDCGILVEPEDAKGLASALERLIDEPETRRRLGASGPARAAELCAPGRILPRFESLLRGACESSKVGAGR